VGLSPPSPDEQVGDQIAELGVAEDDQRYQSIDRERSGAEEGAVVQGSFFA
jgi:hypothetical protein